MFDLARHLWTRLRAQPAQIVCTHLGREGQATVVRGQDLLVRAGGFRAALEEFSLPEASVVAIIHSSGPDLHAAKDTVAIGSA